jgi:DNA-binding NarL/FixJ family response regulator
MHVRSSVTVLLAEFEDLISRGLRALLDEDENIALVAHGVEAAALDAELERLHPHVAIINLATLRSPADLHHLSAHHATTRLLVLANRPSPAEANQLLAFGASGCLSKDTQGRDILNAIHLASRGLNVLPRSAAVSSSPGPDLLTSREADVLEHLREGRSNAEIAIALHVSVETVRTHRRNIYRKLGVRTRRELAALTS